MSAPKFTAGPWKRAHSHPDPVTRASVAYINGGHRIAPLEIASVYGCGNAEQAANADLIAAAPELYAALSALLNFENADSRADMLTDVRLHEEREATVGRARAALAKAVST